MPNHSPLAWIVVADKCKAKIYRSTKFPHIEEVSHFEHPASGLHNQDLISSKPGRSFQSFGATRHSYQPEVEPRQHEAIKFAIELARVLLVGKNNQEFNRLYLIADPYFLGLLRQHIDAEVQKLVAGELAKELTAFDKATVEHHLSEI